MKKLVVLLVLVCATLSFGAFPDPTVWYKICNFKSGKYLQPLNPVAYPGKNSVTIVQNTVDASCYQTYQNLKPYQEWKFVPVTGKSGYFYIQNKYTGLVMNINGNSKNSGALNIQYSNNGGSNEQWKIIVNTSDTQKKPSGKYLYNIQNLNSGMYLDINGASTAENASCIQNNSPNGKDELWLIEDATPWSQTKFEIGSFNGSLFTKADLKRYKEANFNTLIHYKGNANWCFSNSTISSSGIPLSTSTLPPFNYSELTNIIPSASSAPMPMEACLSLLKTVGGLKMLIWDANNNDGVDQHSILYNSNAYKYGTTNHWVLTPDAQCVSDVQSAATIYKNFSQYRSQMLGYFIQDEPDLTVTPPDLPRVNLIQDNLAAADPGMLGYMNFKGVGWPIWDPQWIALSDAVDSYISNPSTKVVSFDYYCFAAWGGLFYFQNFNLFASTIQKYQKLGKQTIFWGNYGASCQEPDLSLNLPIPTDSSLRFYASSNLIYGSKGMNWFTYRSDPPGIPQAIDNNSAIYTSIQKINGELLKMDTILMGLNWIKTVHGASTDYFSGETNLPVVDNTDQIFSPSMPPDAGRSMDQSWWMPDVIAIGEFQPSTGDQSVKYLLIMNKYLSYNNDQQWNGQTMDTYYSVLGLNKKISQFNKSTGAWTSLPTWAYGGSGTTFELIINPGDVQLVKVSNN